MRYHVELSISLELHTAEGLTGMCSPSNILTSWLNNINESGNYGLRAPGYDPPSTSMPLWEHRGQRWNHITSHIGPPIYHVVDHAACTLSQAASTFSRGQERLGLMDRRGTPA
jgi:hypothetical protein